SSGRWSPVANRALTVPSLAVRCSRSSRLENGTFSPSHSRRGAGRFVICSYPLAPLAAHCQIWRARKDGWPFAANDRSRSSRSIALSLQYAGSHGDILRAGCGRLAAPYATRDARRTSGTSPLACDVWHPLADHPSPQSAPVRTLMRLAKYLAHAGVASRRAAETMIVEGRVTVAGQVVLDPARDVDERDSLTVDGRQLAGPEQPVVYAVNKPLGVLSTAQDTHGRPTVVSLVAHALAGTGESRRLYPVGRLDADSSGLILLTNDGALAQRLTHPSFEVPKTYRVRVAGGPVGESAL